MIELEYRGQQTAIRSRRPILLGAGLLLLAWGSSLVGQARVARLDWSGYDPDPGIGQSIANDSRRAKAYLPFESTAVFVDIAAFLITAMAVWRRQSRRLAAVVLVLALGCLGWHGFTCIVLAFFASAV